MLAALAIAVASLATPARPLPLVGSLSLSIAWSPGVPPVYRDVTFTTTATDNDGAVRVATLCYGDGTACSSDFESPSSVDLAFACVFGDNWSQGFTHRYTRSGSFPVTLTVTTRGCQGLPDETESLTYTITVTT